MEILGLAHVKKVAPKLRWGEIKHFCDADLLQAIITHRYDVLSRYTRGMRRVAALELDKMRSALPGLEGIGRRHVLAWMNRDETSLKAGERAQLETLLAKNSTLATIYRMRQELIALWSRSSTTKEQLVEQLQGWCQAAEQSGIEALTNLSVKLRRYA